MEHELGTSELIAGIVLDAKRLGDQYLALLRITLKHEARDLARLLASTLLGTGLWCAGVFFLGLALGHAASDEAVEATWITYATFALLAIGGGTFFLLRLRRGSSEDDEEGKRS